MTKCNIYAWEFVTAKRTMYKKKKLIVQFLHTQPFLQTVTYNIVQYCKKLEYIWCQHKITLVVKILWWQ